MSVLARLRSGSKPSGTDTPARVGALIAQLEGSGPAPLRERPVDDRQPLEIAIVIPPFRRGSGGHTTIVSLAESLAAKGHSLSLWLDDSAGWHDAESATQVRDLLHSSFGGRDLAVEPGFDRWEGADVVLATGWQTAPRVQLLPGAGARAYLVQDHEPDFYPASTERLWAQQTYGWGLHCIAASSWLAELLKDRYGAPACHFDLALDHDVYRPGRREPEPGLVALYARSSTPRRAVPLALLAFELLAARRPELELALFGQGGRQAVPFPCEQLGILAPDELAELYARAQVGVVLSLTNPSLVCLEMMACGLPCVELGSESMRASFGSDGPLSLAAPTPAAIAAAVERLLDDRGAREAARGRGLELVRGRTWQSAADQVLSGIRMAARR